MGEKSEGSTLVTHSEDSTKSQHDTTNRDQLVTTITTFLETSGEHILYQASDQDGFGFETPRGKFFIPAYSFELVSAHPELLLENGIVWTEASDIDYKQRKRYFTGELLHDDKTVRLFRKDSSTANREIEMSCGFPLQETRNSVHLGGGEPVEVNDHVSFRVPKHYATTPHGVIMEYLPHETVTQFIDKLDNEQEAKKVLAAYENLFDFLYNGKYEVFAIPPEPLKRYRVAERMVYIESYDKDSGTIQFIITDLKNRNDAVHWDKGNA